MSQPDHPSDGIAIRLVDVRTVRINAIAWGKNESPPDWAKREPDSNGEMRLAAADDKVIVQISATFAQSLLAVEISLQGLYEVDQKSAGLRQKDAENQPVLTRIPDEYHASLAKKAGYDLYPYLRHAFLTISVQLDPRSRIMLSPPDEWDILAPSGAGPGARRHSRTQPASKTSTPTQR